MYHMAFSEMAYEHEEPWKILSLEVMLLTFVSGNIDGMRRLIDKELEVSLLEQTFQFLDHMSDKRKFFPTSEFIADFIRREAETLSTFLQGIDPASSDAPIQIRRPRVSHLLVQLVENTPTSAEFLEFRSTVLGK